MYTSIEAMHDIAKSIKNESVLLKKIIEYPNIGNGINNKNKTPKKLAIAIFAFCRYNGIMSLLSAFHNVGIFTGTRDLEARIKRLLLGDGADRIALIVMPGIDKHVARQGQELGKD